MLEDFEFVAIRIGEKSHFGSPGSEFAAPIVGPYFKAILLQFIAISHDIIDADTGVHEVFWKFHVELRGIAELEFVLITGDFEMNDLIPG